MTSPPLALAGLTVFERGWMSSNNILLHAEGADAVLVDSSHTLHGEMTEALLRRALAALPGSSGSPGLARVVNTHLHSDHCGGNARLKRAFGCTLTIPPGQWDAVRAWDDTQLSYESTGQVCEPFVPDGRLAPGEVLEAGGRRWQALAAPGHDPHSLILFEPQDGVVITADALWEHGFGVVFPELDAAPGDLAAFDEVGATLDLIESLGARWAIPGHGTPFADIAGSLHTARQRLAAFRAHPDKHARHAIKVLVKYHLMEARSQPWPELLGWFDAVPLYAAAWQRLDRPEGSLHAFGERIVKDLCAAGVLAMRDGVVFDV